MPEVSLSGVYNLQIFNTDGTPAESSRLYTYAAGTTTFKAAYTDSAGTTSHSYTNDGLGGQYIALNARGELPAPLWLAVGGYDLTLKTPAGATVWTRRAEGAEEVPTANRPMGGFKHTGAANASTSGEYIVWGQSATLDDITATGDVAITGDLALTGDVTTDLNIATGQKLNVFRTKVHPTQGLSGNGTITTAIPYGTSADTGGGILLVTGSASTGTAFSAAYVVATKTPGGTGSVASTLLNRTGAANPTLTIGTTGGSDGFVTVVVSGIEANTTFVCGFGF